MTPDDADNSELTRYLLGEVSEAEQTQLEMRYFSDPQMFAELCAWRNDLIDRYVGGELSPELRDRFDAAIEKSWAMNERIRFAETLQEAMETRGAPRPRGAWESVRLFIANHRQASIDMALLLIVLVVVYVILRAFF
jgi:anti-sigma factor RsiW